MTICIGEHQPIINSNASTLDQRFYGEVVWTGKTGIPFETYPQRSRASAMAARPSDMYPTGAGGIGLATVQKRPRHSSGIFGHVTGV